MDPTQIPLRDYQLPEAISWWPPALGWWVLLALLLVVGFGVFFLRKWIKRGVIKKQAKQEMARLRQNQDFSETERVQQLSILIRRICLSVFLRVEMASLTGQAWLLFLDQLMGRTDFSQGLGRALIEAPYSRNTDLETEKLFDLCDQWVDRLPKCLPGHQVSMASVGNRVDKD